MAVSATRVRVFYFATPPTADSECPEAVWSLGKSCKRCPMTCYRQGMSAGQVREDNRKLVEAKNARQDQ